MLTQINVWGLWCFLFFFFSRMKPNGTKSFSNCIGFKMHFHTFQVCLTDRQWMRHGELAWVWVISKGFWSGLHHTRGCLIHRTHCLYCWSRYGRKGRIGSKTWWLRQQGLVSGGTSALMQLFPTILVICGDNNSPQNAHSESHFFFNPREDLECL